MEFGDAISLTFASAPPSTMVSCPAWGADAEEKKLAADISKAPSASAVRKHSESLGEQAGVYILQKILLNKNVDYDDNCLHIYSGANVFNAVYAYPNLKKPIGIIIIETKGGSSQCGSRKSAFDSSRVTQGTVDYAETEAEVMSCSSKSDVSEMGECINKNMGKSKIIYVGVRAPYDKGKGIAYEPEIIFLKEL
ncbi:MAG TPA: hypothetical protein VK638_15495 [Edaphobacter sp.]|nr:hypothetical protein [Edaphobacter sp.]